MDCTTCKERKTQAEPVPFIVHEADMARMERTIKRLWILLILLVALLFGSNAAWIWYESQWEEVVTETYTSESGDRGIAIVNRDGEVNYGEGNVHPDEDPRP